MLLRLLEVVGVALDAHRRAPHVVRQRHRVAGDGAGQDVVDEPVVVEGVGQRLAEVHVVHRRPAVVDDRIEDPHGLLLVDHDVLARREALHLVLRQIAVRAVEVAVHQAEHPGVDLDDGPELDRVQGILDHVPALEAVDCDVLAGNEHRLHGGGERDQLRHVPGRAGAPERRSAMPSPRSASAWAQPWPMPRAPAVTIVTLRSTRVPCRNRPDSSRS